MPLDPAQRHQIEQDAITAAWEAERLAACDDAIALLREVADLDREDDGDVIIGTDVDGHSLFLTDGRVAIDNNPAERALRPIGIGRKNWLFAGADTGAETPRASHDGHRNGQTQ
jgi:hypothetical protein